MAERQRCSSPLIGGNTLGLLGVAFVVLRLCEVIDWPWIWVLAPFWGPLAILLVVVAGLLGISAVCSIGVIIIELWESRKK